MGVMLPLLHILIQVKKTILRAAENIPSKSKNGVSIHSEQVILAEILQMGIPKKNIKRIYTEFEPCNFGTNNCSNFLKSNFPNAKIYWIYPYNQGMNDISRIRKENDLIKYGIYQE